MLFLFSWKSHALPPNSAHSRPNWKHTTVLSYIQSSASWRCKFLCVRQEWHWTCTQRPTHALSNANSLLGGIKSHQTRTCLSSLHFHSDPRGTLALDVSLSIFSTETLVLLYSSSLVYNSWRVIGGFCAFCVVCWVLWGGTISSTSLFVYLLCEKVFLILSFPLWGQTIT